MVKVWFPSFFMRLMKVNKEKTKALFHIPQAMTKWEVKQYLTGIYNLKVTKVDTANFLGQWKRLYGKSTRIAFKRRNFKKAYVEFTEQ